MKTEILFLSVLAACSARAVTLDVPLQTDPLFADREVSADAALPDAGGAGQGFRVFKLTLAFAASPSNNVQVAFGRDSLPADGALAAEETDFIIGLDCCGEWFLRPRGLTERFAVPAAATNGPHTLTAVVRVDRQGAPVSAAFADGGAPVVFPGLALSPLPEWLDPSRWDILRATVRGPDSPEGSVRASFARDGATVTVR